MECRRRQLLLAGASLLAAEAVSVARHGVAGPFYATSADHADTHTGPAEASPRIANAGRRTATRTLRVGPRSQITTVAAAARIARDGDIVEIVAGEYLDQAASWPQNDLTIRAVGGRVRLVSTRASAEDKAIFVVKGDRVVVESIEFSGVRVPSRNGAGIRHEGGKLTVRNCLFERNEMGLLTWNQQTAELVVESSEFRDNAVAPHHEPGEPIGHQLYVGSIGRFTLRDSYVHRGAFGHLVKSRARENFVLNNRVTDESDGRASYELEFPNGGLAYVLGNVIGQSAHTENEAIVSFGAEGYKWPKNELYLINNTLIDALPRGGIFLRAWPGAGSVRVLNNLLSGNGSLDLVGDGDFRANFRTRTSDFAAPESYDYRLRRRSDLVGMALDPGSADGVNLRPLREYAHPRQSRLAPGTPYSPGALQSLAN